MTRIASWLFLASGVSCGSEKARQFERSLYCVLENWNNSQKDVKMTDLNHGDPVAGANAVRPDVFK